MKYFIIFLHIGLFLIFFNNKVVNSQSDISEVIWRQLKMADVFLNELNYDSAEYHYLQVLEELYSEGNWETTCATTNKYIITLWRNEKYDIARRSAYQNLYNCVKHLGNDHPETARIYTNLGVLCFLTGHTGITHEYFVKALDIFNRNFDEQNENSAAVYEWLGIYHNGFSDTANARRYLFEALKLRRQLDQTEDFKSGDLYRYLGLFYKRYSLFDSAFYCFNKAKKLFDKKYSEYNFKSVKCLNNISDIYEWFGQFDTAMDIHNQSLELIKKTKAKNRYTFMMTYFNISELYSNFGDFNNALLYMQKVLKLYYPNIEDQDVYNNPENVEDFPYAIIQTVLAYKSRYLMEIYNKDPGKNYNYLLLSAQCYELLHKIIQAIRSEITNIEELIFYEHINNGLYQEMAKNALQVYKTTSDTSFLSKALTYLSINRNTNQIFSDRQIEKKFLANVPDNYIKSENLLQNELNEFLSKRLMIDKSDPTERINVQIAEKKIELDILAYELVRDNPAIINSVFGNKSIHFQTLVNKLKENQAMIWFHEYCGAYTQIPDSIMIITLSGSDLKYFKIDGKATVNIIKNYQKLISEVFYDIRKIDSVGHLLYSLLFDPVKDIIFKNELIIIPSQHISMIPFDALPVEPSPNPKRMIDCYIIWNEFSILSFLQDDFKSDNKKNNVLAFAPQFNKQQKEAIALLTKRDTSLINLPGAILECENIGTFFKTKIISGADATRSAFEAYCPDYQIIHLSTHAIPDKDKRSTIRLVFSDYQEANKKGSIDLYEVLNLPLNADLVVLSACKTGIGEMSKGEGNINMAWAFNKAGAKSVLVCLWDANDYVSSVIMPKFYEYLSEGLTKPKALRQAKLDFIKSSDELTLSPYFWAGFEYWGDDSTINVKDYSGRRILFTGFLIVLFGVAFIIIIRRKHNSHIRQNR